MEEKVEERNENLLEIKCIPRQKTTEKNNIVMLKSTETYCQSCHKKMNTRNAFYQKLKPLWISLKILGMLPYSFNKKGNVQFIFFSKETLYSIIFYILISRPVYQTMFRRMRMMEEQDNFEDMMFNIVMSCMMITHTIIPLSHWIQMDCFEAAIKAWESFQDEYEALKGSPLIIKANWPILIMGSGLVYYLEVLLFLYLDDFDYWHYIGLLAQAYILAISFVPTIIFMMQICIIVFTARDLRKEFKKVLEREKYDEIPKWIQIWFSLSKLVEYLGNLFYKMYMHLIVSLFFVSTLAIYRMIKSCSLEKGFSSFLTALYLPNGIAFKTSTAMDAFALIFLLLICFIGEHVTCEVGDKFKDELIKLKLMMKNSTGKQNLQEFIDTISQKPPIVHLNGYMKINNKLFTTLLTLGATFLFIAFQFSLTTHESSSSSNNSSQVFLNDSSRVLSNDSSLFFSNNSSQSKL